MHQPAETASRSLSRRFSRGVANMLLATFAFAVMNVFVKQLDRIPAMEIVFFRCLISGMICGVEVARRNLDWKGNNHTLLVARGAFGTLALYTFFLTLQRMPLATAVTIQYLSPIFTALIGVFILHEHVRSRQWLFYGLAFAGVFVIKGFDSRVSTAYLLIGIASAICSGMAYNLVRRLREREEPIVVVLHFQLVGIAAGLGFILLQWETPLPWEWFCLLMCGVLTQIGQICLTKSLQAERVARVAVLNYIGLIYALIFGIAIFGEHYTLQTVLGILLVVAGVLLAVFSGKPKTPAVIEETEPTVL
ncbi:MAG TPA: DMT family transporter [Chthoniobacterales bacterium]|nr:DMT family transporter [Chthoniobacterales bacterium]